MELSLTKGVNNLVSNIGNVISSSDKTGKIITSLKKINLKTFPKQSSTAMAILEEPVKKVPVNDSERFDQLVAIVETSIKEGKAFETQVNNGILKAEDLSLRKPIVGVLVRKIVMDLNKGKSKEMIKEECANFLRF